MRSLISGSEPGVGRASRTLAILLEVLSLEKVEQASPDTMRKRWPGWDSRR